MRVYIFIYIYIYRRAHTHQRTHVLNTEKQVVLPILNSTYRCWGVRKCLQYRQCSCSGNMRQWAAKPVSPKYRVVQTQNDEFHIRKRHSGRVLSGTWCPDSAQDPILIILRVK